MNQLVVDPVTHSPSGEIPDQPLNPMLIEFFNAMIYKIMIKMQNEQNEMEEHKKKIEQALKLSERINQLMDDQGALNIENDQELQKLIEEALENGLSIKNSSTTLNPLQVQQLKDNINSFCERLQLSISFISSALQKLWDVYTQTGQIRAMITSQTNETIKNILHNTKGG